MKQTFSVCVCLLLCLVLLIQPSPVYTPTSQLLTKPASGLIFCCSRARGQWRPYWLGNGMFELGVFRNTSVSALRLLSVRTDPYIYFQNAPPSLCLPLPLLSGSANSQHQNNRGRTEIWREGNGEVYCPFLPSVSILFSFFRCLLVTYLSCFTSVYEKVF